MIRALLCLALIAAPIYLGHTYSAHHEGGGNLFHDLFSHVLPAPLVTSHGDHGADSHAEAGASGHESPEAAHETEALASHASSGHAIPESRMVIVPIPGMPAMFRRTDDQAVERGVPVFNLQIFQVFAVLLLFVAFGGVARTIRTGKGDWLSRMFAGFAGWVRDEMVRPVMGDHGGEKFLPFFLSLFFFVLFMNLLGLFPGGATATANIGVTAALATITLFSMIGLGMWAQGPAKFWLNLVPHGLPVLRWPLMFVIGLVGLVVKPVALTIRLFANMTAGHLIVLSGMGLIYYFGKSGEAAMTGYAVAPLAVGFAVFIMIIESFVALLQAYIFTYLSILFVQACIHPEH